MLKLFILILLIFSIIKLIGIFFFSKSLKPTEEQLAAHREKESKAKEKQES